MRILIFILVLFGASLQAQNVLTCYDYSDFLQSDCVGCGLKDSTFSGILLVKNGTIYQPLVKPIKIKTRPNILDLEDGFATRVSIYIDQITTYNTEASVLAFLRSCVAVESITIGDVTTIIHDSLATLEPDSIYYSAGRVWLRDGSGSALIPVPSVTGTISGHQIGVFNPGTVAPTTPIRETVTTFSGIASGVRTYTSEDGTMYDLDAESTNELQELNLLDSTDRVFTLEITNGNIVKWKDQVGSGVTQYLNPYVVATDTVGFYLTVAQDTVLFQNTIDTASYCCLPSIGNDTLYIGDNYVVLPSGEATTVGDTPTINMTLTGVNITGEVIDGSITPAKLDRTYLTAEVDGSTTNEIELPSQTGNSGKYLSTNGTSPSWETVSGGGGASPIRLKISSGNFTRNSTAQQEWTGGNFRDTITADGYYKIEVYASFISSQTTTGGSFAIRNTVTGGNDAIGVLEVANTTGTSTTAMSRLIIHNTNSTWINGTGTTNTTSKHALYGHVTVYLTNGEIITPTFASEDTNSVEYQAGARLIITKLF